MKKNQQLTSGEVGNSRCLGGQVTQLEALQQAEVAGNALLGGLGHAQQALADGLREADRNIREGLRTT